MKKTYEFEAICSGDGECFCFDIDKKTLNRLQKEAPGFLPGVKSDYRKGMYKMYLTDLIGYPEPQDKLKFKIEISGKNYDFKRLKEIGEAMRKKLKMVERMKKNGKKEYKEKQAKRLLDKCSNET